MEFATSISTGKTYEAVKVNYAQANTLKLVCPVCKEKVFKRVRHIPHETHMFAHHKGGSPDCELYFPAATDEPSTASGLSVSRGQTFEQFISDIDADLQSLLVKSGVIEDRIDRRILDVLSVLVGKESKYLAPSFPAVELSGLDVLGADAGPANDIAAVIFEFYTRDGARFIDALICKWFLYSVYVNHEKANIGNALGVLVGEKKGGFTALTGVMLTGLAWLYAKEDLTRFSENFRSKLMLYSGRLPLCEGTSVSSWTDCIGTLAWPSGQKYVGDWKDGKQNGHGTVTWPDGQKYVGDWIDGKYNGQGSLTWPSGQKYVGDWKVGKRSGQGTLTWLSGQKYVGNFKDNNQNGHGTLTLPSGVKYVGDFKDDKCSGQGTLTLPEGQKYLGGFKDDTYNGHGTYTWPDGQKYVGDWKDGKQNGNGTLTLPSGLKMVGKFKDGKYKATR